MNKRKPLLALAAIISLTLPLMASANSALDWNENIGEIAKAAAISPASNPFHESRLYAMVHLAIHDAHNAVDRRFAPYALDTVALPGTSLDAATAAAAHAVLLSELPKLPDIFAAAVPGAIALADDFYVNALAAIADGPEKDWGIELGQAAAAAIVALRDGDGSDTQFLDFDYPEGTAPGVYRFTDDLPFAAAPEWGKVRPFGLNHASQFRPPPPYSVSCRRPSPSRHSGRCKSYATDLAEVAMLGGNDATGHSRTQDETEIAFFWIESSPLAWNRLARRIAEEATLDSWESARLFGLLNIGLTDGYIASMDTKYYYNYWRPVTAIREADDDGNPGTFGWPDWTPADPTPPIPDYDSAHSVEGAVAAEILKLVFGTDHWPFQVCSLTLPDSNQHCGAIDERLRSFSRFSDAARENGESRILVGYHFRLAVEAGLEHGRKVGAFAVRRHLKPVD